MNTEKITVRGEIEVTPLPGLPGWRHFFDTKLWRLKGQFAVLMGGVEWLVPCGWVFDFASIPRLLKPIFPDKAIFGYGPTFHDWLYKTGLVSKWMADALLYEVLVDVDRVNRFTASVMWLGVTLGGWSAWRNHRKREKAKQ